MFVPLICVLDSLHGLLVSRCEITEVSVWPTWPGITPRGWGLRLTHDITQTSCSMGLKELPHRIRGRHHSLQMFQQRKAHSDVLYVPKLKCARSDKSALWAIPTVPYNYLKCHCLATLDFQQWHDCSGRQTWLRALRYPCLLLQLFVIQDPGSVCRRKDQLEPCCS